MPALLLLIILWLSISLLLIWIWRRPLLALWREPVLRDPVLIIESDDWGAGPTAQAGALQDLAARLQHFRDQRGQPPVMTLGVILAVAKPSSTDEKREYRRIILDDPRLTSVRDAMLAGVDAGVFSLQLHGMEHYRPASLMKAAETNPVVAEWLSGQPLPSTEPLPSPLQSRWTDSATLPSTDLSPIEIDAMVAEETTTFAQLFGHPARVVVPPTFQWTETVERAWARAGVETLISPGRRLVRRDADGGLVDDGSRQYNGGQGPDGIRYLVRDAWFEPSLGHRAAKGLQALTEHSALGRPTLLETHRYNFLGDAREDSLQELTTLLREALEQHPGLRFIASADLAEHLAARASDWVQTTWRPRAAVFLARLERLPRIGRLARIGAFGIPLSVARRLLPRCPL
jgi:hypothetical protein